MPRVHVPTAITPDHVIMMLRGLEKGQYTDEEIGAALAVSKLFEKFLAGTKYCSCTLTRIRQDIEFYEQAIEYRRRGH